MRVKVRKKTRIEVLTAISAGFFVLVSMPLLLILVLRSNKGE